MSSGLIQRRMAAIVRSRPMSSMVAAGQNLHRTQHPEFLHHGNAPQSVTHRDQSPTSRGLAHYTKEGTSPTEKQQRQQHQKKTTSLEQPSHNQKHQGHIQTPYLQRHSRRPSTTQAQQSSGTEATVPAGDDSIHNTYSVMASQKMFHETVEDWAQTSFHPETRLQTAVERFRDRFFVDELPCRTRKSVAEAAAAGKGYITAGDISRVFETISDENNLLTEDEAHAIIHAAWSRQGPGYAEGREGGGRGRAREEGAPDEDTATYAGVSRSAQAGTGRRPRAAAAAEAKISTEEFVLVLQPKNPAKTK